MNKRTETALNVPLLDLKAQYESIRGEMDAAVLAVMSGQKGILGPEVAQLEERIAAYCISKHGVAVASGTDALLLALMALKIGSGDGVITSPYTFFATAGSIARVGARPFFVDIEADTFNLDPQALSRFLKNECDRKGGAVVHKATKTAIKAVMPVHLYGQTADMAAIMSLGKEWGLPVVEDACQAIGATFDGKMAGTLGDFGALSFFPSKNLGGLGDGGMVLTQNEKWAHDVKVLRVHGSEPKYYHKVIGINSRLDTLQAAILLVKLKYLKTWTEARAKNAQLYDTLFVGNKKIKTPVVATGRTHVYNQYCIRVQNRDGLKSHLEKNGINTEIYYPLPLHLQECFKFLGHRDGSFPESEKAARESLALPVYPELTAPQIEYVAETVIRFFTEKTNGAH